MRSHSRAAFVALAAAKASFGLASTLADICTTANVISAIPANGTLLGINLILSSVTAEALYNISSGAGGMKRRSTSSSTETYCNITLAYTHPGKDDVVNLILALPEPSAYQSRFYVAGGGGYSLATSATGGLTYGAAGAATDAGYDAFSTSCDDVVLKGNGSIDWDATYMFGYGALGEMTKVAKAILPGVYGAANGTKVYTYYEGCSDGGREGMSQVQRWGDEYDGAITGAPAIRMGQQQANHVYSSLVESTLDYYPPPCALAKIVNATITACDPLDGRTDGVISRTDLCQLNFNLSSIIGESFYCADESATSLGFGYSTKKSKRQASSDSSTSYEPAQNGSVTAQDVEVAQLIYDGLHNSEGERAYLSWQIGSELGDAGTVWSNSTGWGLDIPSTGGEWITKYIQLLNLTNLSDLDGVTYDTLVEWMDIGMTRFLNSLQTTIPDLTTFQSSGGKLIHYHGESDPSVPAASSAHYWQSVRGIMYPDMSDAEAQEEMAKWYQLYFVPGAAHCGVNSLQPGPYPEDNMETLIDWVEGGIQPTRLNATVQSGTYKGEVQMLCQWPSRPLWVSNSTFDCVNDTASIDKWTYSFPAFKVPVY